MKPEGHLSVPNFLFLFFKSKLMLQEMYYSSFIHAKPFGEFCQTYFRLYLVIKSDFLHVRTVKNTY